MRIKRVLDMLEQVGYRLEVGDRIEVSIVKALLQEQATNHPSVQPEDGAGEIPYLKFFPGVKRA